MANTDNTDWKDIDTYRKAHLAVAELVDAWRVVPRLLVGGYSYLIFVVVKWYMSLEPRMIEDCMSLVVTECIYQAPTTQHAALVTAVVGIAAVVFGVYANSSRKWNGFTFWNYSKPEEVEATPQRRSTDKVEPQRWSSAEVERWQRSTD